MDLDCIPGFFAVSTFAPIAHHVYLDVKKGKATLVGLGSRLELLSRQLLASVINAVFLGLWVLLQYFLNEYVIKPYAPIGIAGWVLDGYRILFGVATLFPVGRTVYNDVKATILTVPRAGRSGATEL